MGWLAGNKPLGKSIRSVSVWREIFYAINERQDMMGATPYVWSRLGKAYPDAADLVGLTPEDFSDPTNGLLVELREAIESANPPEARWAWKRGSTYCACQDDTYEEQVTFAWLYNTAMGSGTTWKETISGGAIGDVTFIEELLKTCELLKYYEAIGQADDYCLKSIFSGGWFDTTDAAYADAVARGLQPSYGIYESTAIDYNAETDKYNLYRTETVVIMRWPAIDGPSNFTPTIDDRQVFIEVWKSAWPAAETDTNCTVYARTSDSTEFSTPAWTATGSQVGSHYCDDVATTAFPISCSDGFSFEANNYYRLDTGQFNQFTSDPNEARATYEFEGYGKLRVCYQFTGWTFG